MNEIDGWIEQLAADPELLNGLMETVAAQSLPLDRVRMGALISLAAAAEEDKTAAESFGTLMSLSKMGFDQSLDALAGEIFDDNAIEAIASGAFDGELGENIEVIAAAVGAWEFQKIAAEDPEVAENAARGLAALHDFARRVGTKGSDAITRLKESVGERSRALRDHGSDLTTKMRESIGERSHALRARGDELAGKMRESAAGKSLWAKKVVDDSADRVKESAGAIGARAKALTHTRGAQIGAAGIGGLGAGYETGHHTRRSPEEIVAAAIEEATIRKEAAFREYTDADALLKAAQSLD